VIVLKKALVLAFLMLLMGFALWRLVAGELSSPAEDIAKVMDEENFAWFDCSSCGNLFMAEATTRKGYCPYCKFQMMLVTEDKRVMGKRAGGDDFKWFFSHECGNIFFAHASERVGSCPYCAEPVDLSITETPVVANAGSVPLQLAAWTRAHSGKLVLGAFALIAVSIAGICLVIENRIVLSLNPIEGAVSQVARIELSKRQAKKKKLTMGSLQGDDIFLAETLLHGARYVFSFVQVGGKIRAYLSRSQEDQPVLINEETQFNPRLRNHDRIKLGDVVFEVSNSDRKGSS
jgi:DNA-directed RNA polymerase subunit RPC12/RpoP